MKIYNYDRETGEYISESDARPSPLEPGVYLIPAYAATIEPPAVEGQQATVFADGEWAVVDDYRDTDVWEKATGHQVDVYALGPLPDSLTLVSPGELEFPVWAVGSWVEDVEAIKAVMVGKITAEEDRVSWLPIEFPAEAGIFHKVTTAIPNTIERHRGLQNTDPLPINGGCWDDAGGNPVPFTCGDLVGLQQAVYDRAAYNYWVKKYHIAEMAKLAKPQNYDYLSGWK